MSRLSYQIFHLELRMLADRKITSFSFCFPEKLIKHLNCCLLGEYIWTGDFHPWALVSSSGNKSFEFIESVSSWSPMTFWVAWHTGQTSLVIKLTHSLRKVHSKWGIGRLLRQVSATPGLLTLCKARWVRRQHSCLPWCRKPTSLTSLGVLGQIGPFMSGVSLILFVLIKLWQCIFVGKKIPLLKFNLY